MVAVDYLTGESMRWWLHETDQECPFGADDLLVAYYASAEIGCMLSLGWEPPTHVLDLYPEFKNMMAGRTPYAGSGLLGAAQHFNIPAGISSEDKDGMRDMAQAETFSSDDISRLMNYCHNDVTLLGKILVAMLPSLDIPRALLRGRYMRAAGYVEHTGIPIDVQVLEKLKAEWIFIKLDLITKIDAEYGVFDGSTFKADRWMDWCSANKIGWPMLATGAPDLKDETFSNMAKANPAIRPMHELRFTLGQMKLQDLPVGVDARNRYLLSAFKSVTGRNQPSSSKCVFGPATWIRNLIKPEPGMAIAYLDYEQQEFGIMAALSGDKNMAAAYESGDPYLTFAKQAGAVPDNATKKSHPVERDLYKNTALAVQYGMGAESLGARIGRGPGDGKTLLAKHKDVYAAYWRWSDSCEIQGMLGLPLSTVFGWRTLGKAKHYDADQLNPRTFRNFPAQANGSEMLRLAIIALVESGILVCAPVHDAVLIEAPSDEIEQVVETAKAIMEAASRCVLGGFTIKTDCKIVKSPDRYSDPRGTEMWQALTTILEANPNVAPCHSAVAPCHAKVAPCHDGSSY